MLLLVALSRGRRSGWNVDKNVNVIEQEKSETFSHGAMPGTIPSPPLCQCFYAYSMHRTFYAIL